MLPIHFILTEGCLFFYFSDLCRVRRGKFISDIVRYMLSGIIVFRLICGLYYHQDQTSYLQTAQPEQAKYSIEAYNGFIPLHNEIKVRSQYSHLHSVNRIVPAFLPQEVEQSRLIKVAASCQYIQLAESCIIRTESTDLIFPFHYFL